MASSKAVSVFLHGESSKPTPMPSQSQSESLSQNQSQSKKQEQEERGGESLDSAQSGGWTDGRLDGWMESCNKRSRLDAQCAYLAGSARSRALSLKANALLNAR